MCDRFIDEKFFEMLNIGNAVSEALDKTDDITVLQCVLGTCLDQWTADKGYSYEDMHQALTDLLEVHETVNRELGMMAKTA